MSVVHLQYSLRPLSTPPHLNVCLHRDSNSARGESLGDSWVFLECTHCPGHIPALQDSQQYPRLLQLPLDISPQLFLLSILISLLFCSTIIHHLRHIFFKYSHCLNREENLRRSLPFLLTSSIYLSFDAVTRLEKSVSHQCTIEI